MRHHDISLIPDHCSRQGAAMLADRIRSYWIKAGYKSIEVSIVATQGTPERKPWDSQYVGEIFVIKTNIGPRGYPPG